MELFPLTSIGSIVGTEAAASGRRCGECTACCDGWLKINVYGVEVYPGHPCPHSSGHHCLIYERRPLDPCQRFFCGWLDRKSTRLNSSHVAISYAVFCLKKKNTKKVTH